MIKSNWLRNLVIAISFIFFFGINILYSKNIKKCLSDPPNIILILVDDLGFETLKAYGGSSYNTPYLDKMISEGVFIPNCYSQPTCTPSRIKLLTGLSK